MDDQGDRWALLLLTRDTVSECECVSEYTHTHTHTQGTRTMRTGRIFSPFFSPRPRTFFFTMARRAKSLFAVSLRFSLQPSCHLADNENTKNFLSFFFAAK